MRPAPVTHPGPVHLEHLCPGPVLCVARPVLHRPALHPRPALGGFCPGYVHCARASRPRLRLGLGLRSSCVAPWAWAVPHLRHAQHHLAQRSRPYFDHLVVASLRLVGLAGALEDLHRWCATEQWGGCARSHTALPTPPSHPQAACCQCLFHQTQCQPGRHLGLLCHQLVPKQRCNGHTHPHGALASQPWSCPLP